MFLAKKDAENDSNVSRESEQVRETPEEYLDWYMNRNTYDILDKMPEMEESIEQDCS